MLLCRRQEQVTGFARLCRTCTEQQETGRPCRCRCNAHGAESRAWPDRRKVCLATPVALLSAAPSSQGPAQATLVDEATAQRVLESAARAVVCVKVAGSPAASGVLWTALHVICNTHYLSQATPLSIGSQRVSVSWQDPQGSLHDAPTVLVAFDASLDLAVLELQEQQPGLLPIQVGSSADLRVGQDVYTVGRPTPQSCTLSAGIVSGLKRSIPSPVATRIVGAIQTDALVNRGNSGGPLLDSGCRMVGFTTSSFVKSDVERSSGVNFAVPVGSLLESVPQLILTGSSSGQGLYSRTV